MFSGELSEFLDGEGELGVSLGLEVDGNDDAGGVVSSSSNLFRYFFTSATVRSNNWGPEYPPCSSMIAASCFERLYPPGSGSGLRLVVVLPAITPAQQDCLMALQMPAIWSSLSSSGLTFTMTTGFVLRLALLAAATTLLRMSVSLSTCCRLRNPGVFGLDTLNCVSDDGHVVGNL